MLKNIILIFIVVVFVLTAGVFNVDVRENAVVSNNYNKTQSIYATGLHFAVPGLTSITYVYINERTAVLSIPVSIINESSINNQIQALVSWHVMAPITYVNLLNQAGKDGVTPLLVSSLSQALQQNIAKLNENELNQSTQLIEAPLNFSNLGLTVDSIVITNIKSLLDATAPEVTSISNAVSEDASAPIAAASQVVPAIDTRDEADTDQLQIESAYYAAQQIKTQTEIDQANLYGQIQTKNTKFYDYFRKVEIYRASAESKGEIPPLLQLYN